MQECCRGQQVLSYCHFAQPIAIFTSKTEVPCKRCCGLLSFSGLTKYEVLFNAKAMEVKSVGREAVKGNAFEGDISFVEWQGLRAVHRVVMGKPFCEQVIAYMEYWQWDAADFCAETGLLQKTHSEIIHGKVRALRLESVVALGIGLKLGASMINDLLRAARAAFYYDVDDDYFSYLVETKVGKSLAACNRFLTQHGQPRLGSKSRKQQTFSPPH